jgi:hypothetical protein
MRRYPRGGTLTGFTGEPLRPDEGIGRKPGSDMGQLNIEPFRWYIASHPDHVRQVFRDNFRKGGQSLSPPMFRGAV